MCKPAMAGINASLAYQQDLADGRKKNSSLPLDNTKSYTLRSAYFVRLTFKNTQSNNLLELSVTTTDISRIIYISQVCIRRTGLLHFQNAAYMESCSGEKESTSFWCTKLSVGRLRQISSAYITCH